MMNRPGISLAHTAHWAGYSISRRSSPSRRQRQARTIGGFPVVMDETYANGAAHSSDYGASELRFQAPHADILQ
jgi:hypothetical protein